jgi:hypothetical protein
MHNWDGMREQILSGAFSSPLSPDRKLQQLAIEDLGAMAVILLSLFSEGGRTRM